MNEITVKLTDRELVLLTALLGRTNGRYLLDNLFTQIRDLTGSKELISQYYEAYDFLGEDIDLNSVAEEVFE